MITPEQRPAIDAARKDIVDTRKQLRDVQLELNREISRLETWLRVFNIVLVPAAAGDPGDRSGLISCARRRRARATRMKPRTLLVLVVVGVLAVAGGWYFGTADRPSEQQAYRHRQADVPRSGAETEGRAADRDHQQGKITASSKHGDAWGLADRGGYPVQESKLRGMLTTLTELRLVEPRTTDPAQFSRLGVEDPQRQGRHRQSAARAGWHRQADRAVIVGHRRMRTQGNVPEQVYVRRPGDNQTWLAEGGLQADADPQVWLDRDIINIAHALITKVVATHGDDESNSRATATSWR